MFKLPKVDLTVSNILSRDVTRIAHNPTSNILILMKTTAAILSKDLQADCKFWLRVGRLNSSLFCFGSSSSTPKLRLFHPP